MCTGGTTKLTSTEAPDKLRAVAVTVTPEGIKPKSNVLPPPLK